MCFAIPGLIVSIKEGSAVVSYNGEERKCKLLVEAEEGDYVLVQSNYAVRKVPKGEALKIFEAVK